MEKDDAVIIIFSWPFNRFEMLHKCAYSVKALYRFVNGL